MGRKRYEPGFSLELVVDVGISISLVSNELFSLGSLDLASFFSTDISKDIMASSILLIKSIAATSSISCKI